MKLFFSKRAKLVVAAIVICLIVLSGSIYGLAKTGVIHIKMLADETAPPTAQYGNIIATVIDPRVGPTAPAGANYTVTVTPGSASTPASGQSNAAGQVTFRVQAHVPVTLNVDNSGCPGVPVNNGIEPGAAYNISVPVSCSGTGGGGGQTTTTVHGKVVDNVTGAVVHGAIIRFKETPASVGRQTNTTQTGDYSIANISTGAYTATATDPYGGKGAETKTVTLVAGDNTINFSLSKTAPAPQTYSILVSIRDAISDEALSGVLVNGTSSESSTGVYAIADLNVATASTQTFLFHKEGYLDQTKTLADLGINRVEANQGRYTSSKGVKLVPADKAKFSIYGKVANRSDALQGNVAVKLSCEDCSNKTWNTTTQGTTMNTFPAVTDAYNYVIQNVDRFNADGSPITRFLLRPEKRGYATSNELSFTGSDLMEVVIGPGQTKASVLHKDFDFNMVKANIGGLVKFVDGSPAPDLKMQLTKPDGSIVDTATELSSAPPVAAGETPQYLDNYHFINIDPQDGYYTLELIYDAAKYSVETFPKITIPYSELVSNLDSSGLAYTLKKDFVVKKKIPATTDKFTMALDIGEDVFTANVKVEVSVPAAGWKANGTTSNSMVWNKGATLLANVAIPDIPLADGLLYSVKISQMDDGTVHVPNPETFTFTRADIASDRLKGNFFYSHIELTHQAGTIKKSIEFRDASTGQPIDLTKQNIITNKLSCLGAVNSIAECKNVSTVARQGNNAMLDYTYTAESALSTLILTFRTGQYTYVGSSLTPDGTSLAYLLPNNAMDTSIFCKNLAGVDYCTYKALEDAIFTQSAVDTLSELSVVIKRYATMSRLAASPDVLIVPDGDRISYGQNVNAINAGDLNSQFYISLPQRSTTNLSDAISVVAQTLSNITNFGSSFNQLYRDRFNNAIKLASGLNSDGSHITVNNLAVNSCSQIYQNYQIFSNLNLAANSDDLWAQFFSFWSSGQLQDALSDGTLSQAENRHCRTALTYLDGIMQNAFPSMILFRKQDAAPKSVQPDQFKAIMAKAGYVEVPRNNYDFSLGILESSLTPQQIMQGYWLQENYNKLDLKTKTTLRVQALQTRIANVISSNSTLVSITNQMNQINAQIEELLTKIGVKFSTTKLTGILYDQHGPATGLMVTLNGKSGLSNNYGNFEINRLAAGRHNIIVRNTKLNKTYTATPSNINILKNSSLTARFTINRKYVGASGRIFKANGKPINGGTIYFGKYSTGINSNGTFSISHLQEDGYEMKIKDASGKELIIANPGDFMNVKNVKLTSYMRSDIHLK